VLAGSAIESPARNCFSAWRTPPPICGCSLRLVIELSASAVRWCWWLKHVRLARSGAACRIVSTACPPSSHSGVTAVAGAVRDGTQRLLAAWTNRQFAWDAPANT